MKPETVQKILDKVKSDYNTIAVDFDKSRQELWPGSIEFKKYVQPGDNVLDAGCGNGKLRLMFKDVKVDYFGVDISQNLLTIAQKNSQFALPNQQFFNAEIFQLPFADNFFDVIFCIAVFHHLPGYELRLKALREFQRVLKPGGVLVMSNWNRWQRQSIYYIIKFTFLKIFGKSDLAFKDIFLPWQEGKVKRYYHAFTLGELKKLVIKSDLNLVDQYLSYWDISCRQKVWPLGYIKGANIVTVAKK